MGQRRWNALAPAPERRLPMQGKRMQGESAKQVTIDVLRAAGEPLHAKEVAKRVIESGRCSRLKGKTPEATVAAILAVGSKPGGRSSGSTGAPTRSPTPPRLRPRRRSRGRARRRRA
jgi:hypothetical protein